MSQGVAIATGCAFVGALCVIGAINQMRTGKTWGLAGGGRVFRSEQPGYFWFLFAARVVLGPLALIAGLLGLVHLHAGS